MLSAIGRKLNFVPQTGNDGLQEHIEELDRKLKRIEVTIEDVESREIHDEAVNLWLQELKYLACDAEDVLDEYHYEILRCQLEVKLSGTSILSDELISRESNSGMVNHFSSYFSKVKPSGTSILSDELIGRESNSGMVNHSSSYILESISRKMIQDIRKINARFDEISKDRKALELTIEEGKRRDCVTPTNTSRTSHLLNKDEIFGRSEDKKNISHQLLSGLCDEERIDQLRVISILGMGGIGKTTLAQMVYHDLSAQSLFDMMAWVYVSPEFDIVRLTREISESVTGNSSFYGFSKAQEVLQNEVKGKTMFLVLDDVWNVQRDDWESLFLPLKVAKLVRVLVTSRNDGVVQVPHSVSPYRLQLLPIHECLELLYHCALGAQGMSKKVLSQEIGEQIITKCGRLPLAVRCIGRVLHYTRDQYRWREILDNELWESDELDPVFGALKLSYYNLCPKLRECFLFCSLFPKGSRLRKMPIIYMWMAHGFLQDRNRSAEDIIGEEYLLELQLRSFVVPCSKSSFYLHDVIYDLARSLSGGEIHTIVDLKSSYIPEKIRHLYIKKGNNPCQSFRPQWLRTLFDATQRTYDSFIDQHDIRSVRVLGLMGPTVLSLEHSQLKHLRYLAIMEFNGETLPKSLCLLYHLQTLEITRCHYLRELPENIANLVNLRYLHITHVGIEELPVMLWRVNNLQMLRLEECYNLRIVPSGISDLTNLHTLQLKSCRQLEELPADTGDLVNLSLLDLSFSGIRTFPASICQIYSAKVVLVGVPDSVKKQLYLNLVKKRSNGIKGLSWEDEDSLIVASVLDLSSSHSHHMQCMTILNMQTRQEYPSGINRKIGRENTPTIAEDIVYTIAEDIDSRIVEDIDSEIVEDNDFGSRVTWMSSQNQSSIRGYTAPSRKCPDPKMVSDLNQLESNKLCELTEDDEMIFVLDLDSDLPKMID